MKQCQLSVILIGIAVLVILIALYQNNEFLEPAPAKKTVYITEEEKPKERTKLNLKEISEEERVSENVAGNLNIQKDTVSDFKYNISNNLVEWKCYKFNDVEEQDIKNIVAQTPSTNSGTACSSFEECAKIRDDAEKQVCVSSPDRVWTGGDNSNYPTCGSCKCCLKTPISTCAPSNGIWSMSDEYDRPVLNSPCCQPPNYDLPPGYKKCGDNLDLTNNTENCIDQCCKILASDKTKYDQSWYPMSRCACSMWCYHSTVPHFRKYGNPTGYIYRRTGPERTFYYGQ